MDGKVDIEWCCKALQECKGEMEDAIVWLEANVLK
jgi:translation elongation factor EF-Ts